jgi:lipopolysaccharide export system protein LptC
MTAEAIGAPAAGWHDASQRTKVERTVRAAGRHSRFVRVLRVALPTTTVMAIGAYVALSYYNPMAALASLPSISGKLGVQGSKITMESPKIAGIGRNQRGYQVTAETAVQDITKPDQLELKNLRAEIEMADTDILVVTAKTGTYHTKADKVTLREHVVFTTAQGLNAKMSEAVVDMKKGTLQSDRFVDFRLPSGRVQANAVEIEDSGEVVRFSRGVIFDLDADEPEAKK